MFLRCLRADLFKMKRSSVLVSHIIIPIVVSVVFLLYYMISYWDTADKIIAFYQVLGSAFPILIGIFTASTMEQEQNAGAFQNLLTLKSKTAALFSKVVVLIILSFFALLLTAFLFGYGFEIVLGQGSMGIGMHIAAALIMWLSAIPLYLIFEILAFVFGKGVSIGAGLFSGLISALFLTNLGMYVWKSVPLSWTARMPDMYLKHRLGELSAISEVSFLGSLVNSQLPICLIFVAICLVVYYAFAVNFEGGKVTE